MGNANPKRELPRTSSEFGEIFEAEFDDGTPVFGVMLPFGGFGQLECTTDDSSNDSLTLLQLLIEQWDEICQEIASRIKASGGGRFTHTRVKCRLVQLRPL